MSEAGAFVLIFWLYGAYSGFHPATAYFNNQAACEYALAQVKDRSNKRFAGGFCTPKQVDRKP